MSDGDLQPSATVAVLLDLWGQTVAYRAACLSGVRWAQGQQQPRSSRSPSHALEMLEKGQRNHVGLELNAWRLCKDWHRLTRIIHTYPRRAELLPDTVKILASLTGPAKGYGVTGRQGDLRTIQCAHVSITRLLVSPRIEDGNMRWRYDHLHGLICWLYAVPHYTDGQTSLESYVAHRNGKAANSDEIDGMKASLRRWYGDSHGRLSRVITQKQILEEFAPRLTVVDGAADPSRVEVARFAGKTPSEALKFANR